MRSTETPKRIKFAPGLVPSILSGEKTATWRLWDDKDLAVGEALNFINAESQENFAAAVVIDVIEKPLGQLTHADKLGQEPFASESEMYRTLSGYYHRPVAAETEVKVVKFELVA